MNRELLEKPFPPGLIKQRQGNFGETLDYLESWAVIQRLNEALSGQWSFSILSHEIRDDEVIVLGQLSADGVVKTQFGSCQVARSKKDNNIISIGDALKGAGSDSLKKCASLLGVGLHLYAGAQDEKHKSALASEARMAVRPSVDGRVTNAQMRAIQAIARSKGLADDTVRGMCAEIFGVAPEALNLKDASAFIGHLKAC